jgi:NTE family protein
MIIRIFLITLLSISLYGAERPKIGLVLSGGGARGGAHLGVIKEFEKYRIPIDAIVGTSMGAFVGGLYASGMSSAEIEKMLTTTQWSKYIAIDYDRKEIPFRRKRLQRDFPGSLKVGINKDNDIVLGTGLFKRQQMLGFLKKETHKIAYSKDFDNLRIPFRAVASDLKTGETVVLKSGSLAESIYASIEIPGGFDPIVIDGKTLVDGGVADNLPLDVMRKEMNMDIIVVIDISTPFDKDPRFDNYISILGQLSDILMRKNVEQTIASMRKNEILITPDLEGYTPLDSDKYPEIIKIGEETIEKDYDSKLSQLSLDKDAYDEYSRQINSFAVHACPIIDKIEIDNNTYLNDTVIRKHLHVKPGDKIDYDQLDSDMQSIYNMMIFDDVKCDLSGKDGVNTLKITTEPSWDVNGQLKFAFGFEDDFSGRSDYSVKFEYIMFGLNSYGGEWRNRFTIGIEKLIYTELYQPLDALQRWYIRPNLFYRDKKIYVSPTILTTHKIKADLDDSIPLQAREYGGEVGLGFNISNDFQFEVGLTGKIVNPKMNVIYEDANGTRYDEKKAKQDIVEMYASLKMDSFDDAYFPTQGYEGELAFLTQLTKMGSEADFSQLYGEITAAFSYKHHTILPTLKIGTTYKADDFDNAQDFSAFYTLGGLFNLSGLPTNAISGDHVVFASLLYRYRITEDNFFGTLGMPVYAGFSMEVGDTWYREFGNTIDNKDLIYAGSTYLSANTFLGAFYLGFGVAEGGYYSLHLSLGKTF